MQLPFGLSAYSRANGRLPSVRLINLFAEKTPTTATGVVLLPRYGLHLEYETPPVAAVRGIFVSDGVFGGAVLTVQGGRLFSGATEGDVIDGVRLVEWAYTVDGLFILGDEIVYQTTDGLNVVDTEFPDGAAVASITSLDNFLIAVRADTGTVYFRVPGDTTWNALDFFSAESEPDPAVCVRTLAGYLYVFGSSSVEVYSLTGNAETPFSRVDGLGADRGIKDRDSAVKMDNSIIWVGENSIVYRMEGVPKQVSNPGIEERIERSSECKAFTYSQAGHELWVCRLDTETIVLDVSTGEWTTFDWDVRVGTYDGNQGYVGNVGGVYTLRDQPHDDGVGFERLFTAVLPAEAPGSVDCIEVQTSPGTAPTTAEPAIIAMRWSDDQARNWTDWKDASTGFSGQYRHRARWRRGGMVDAPGRVMEFRITDPVDIRFSGVDLNPAGGGRSRG